MSVTLYEPVALAAWPDALTVKHWVERPVGVEGFAKPEPGHGILQGHQWQPFELAGWLYDAGWRDLFDLTVMLSVGLGESQGFDQAIHVNLDLSEDRGWLQISSVHRDCPDSVAYDPIAACDYAYEHLYLPKQRAGKTGFEDWVAFTSSVYLHDSYWGRALRGVADMAGVRLMALPVKPLPDGSPYVHKFKHPVLDFWHRNVEQLHHVELATKALGPLPRSAPKTAALQELARARTASKAALPST